MSFLTQSVRLVKVAGAAGEHSTVTDVADAAAPHLRLFQLTGRVAVNTPTQQYCTHLRCTTANGLYLSMKLFALHISSLLSFILWGCECTLDNHQYRWYYRLCVENDSKLSRETSRLRWASIGREGVLQLLCRRARVTNTPPCQIKGICEVAVRKLEVGGQKKIQREDRWIDPRPILPLKLTQPRAPNLFPTQTGKSDHWPILPLVKSKEEDEEFLVELLYIKLIF